MLLLLAHPVLLTLNLQCVELGREHIKLLSKFYLASIHFHTC